MLTYRAINNDNIRHAGRDTTAAKQGSTIYRRVKPAKLLPHTAHRDWINRTGLTSWAFTDKVHYSIYRPRKDERLSRPGWLVTYRNKVPPPAVEPGHVTHPSTNRARRRITSLIRPTPLPLRHAANRMIVSDGFYGLSNRANSDDLQWRSRSFTDWFFRCDFYTVVQQFQLK